LDERVCDSMLGDIIRVGSMVHVCLL